MILDLVKRYQYKNTLGFEILWVDIEYLVLLMLIFINPKGIRMIVISVLLVLIYFSTVAMFFYPRSSLPLSLIHRNIFYKIMFDSSIVYVAHIILYIMFIYSMAKPKKANEINNDLIDQ